MQGTQETGSIPGSGRFPGVGNGKLLQYSCLGILWTEQPGRLQSMGSQSPTLLGASVRNSALGKGHEEGGSVLCKGEIEPQETPCSRASTPKTRVPTLLFYTLTYTSDFMGG